MKNSCTHDFRWTIKEANQKSNKGWQGQGKFDDRFLCCITLSIIEPMVVIGYCVWRFWKAWPIMNNMLFKNGLARKIYYESLIHFHGIVLGNGHIILLGLIPIGEGLSFSRHCIKSHHLHWSGSSKFWSNSIMGDWGAMKGGVRT